VDPKRSAKPGGAGGPGSPNPPHPPISRWNAPAAGMRRPAPPPPPVSALLDQLGRDIKQLQVDFERFFNGALPFPPEEQRNRVQGQLRHLRNLNLSSSVDSFRMADLESRYNTYSELWNRRVRDIEEGRGRNVRPAVPEAPRYDVQRGILIAGAVEPAAAEALYQGLARSEAPKFDLESFRTYLERQAAAIRVRTGCDQVQFRLASEDGKMKLKARPVGETAG
jgi:hypothetical protein